MSRPSPSQKQPTISSYFFSQSSSPSKTSHKTRLAEKRSASSNFVDLTGDAEDAQPTIKKSKVQAAHYGGPELSGKYTTPEPESMAGPSNPRTPSKKSVVGSAEKYRFAESSGIPNVNETPEQTRAKRARREAFKKKLLGDNGLFSRTSKQIEADTQPQTSSDDFVDIDDLESIRGAAEKEDSPGSSDGETSALPESIRSKAFSKPAIKGGKRNKSDDATSLKKDLRPIEEEIGPSGQTFTPLERQIIRLKKKYPDALLMVEVGYKYRFFGEDARIASKILSIANFPDRNFQTASIPSHRREIHLKNLLSHGYKVGIIGQTETAALKKVSGNRNNPFERKLVALYTAATYIDEVDSEDDPQLITPPVFVCIEEGLLGGMGADERVSISMVAVTPSTGDVVWDEFEDGFMRNELETRLAHIKPSEILLPRSGISKMTEKVLQHLSREAASKEQARDRVRLERRKNALNYTDAFQKLQTFYAQKNYKKASENFKSGKLLAAVLDLPKGVSIALAHSLDYLLGFGLADALAQTEFFNRFTEREHMLLNANTLSNLEIYQNQTDFTFKGSLMWALKKTRTTFGARLLRSWIGRPLVDMSALQARLDAVEAILSAESVSSRERLMRLRELLKTLRDVDLARGLSRIQYSKCTPRELGKLLKAFSRVASTYDAFQTHEEIGLSSPILNSIVFILPKIKESINEILSCIDLRRAEENDRTELWLDPDKYPEIDEMKFALSCIKTELDDELRHIRKILKKPTAQYITKGQDEYLIEVRKDERRDIPLTWEVVSSIKSARRYRTPEVNKKLQERAQYQERLEAAAHKAYLTFLAEIMDDHYVGLRNTVNNLAIADCLFSLAELASQDNFTKPAFVQGDILEITDGRHPMIELLREDPFLSNSICMGGTDTRTKIITGPNMGGKSSTVRMVALIALMAQIGSYVPASSVRLSPLDAILTRMGASDDLARGRSTFMVEMSETSDILHAASERSLVILDELGRGSSTFDGMAIAGATLEHLVEIKNCKTLFITHYPVVALSAERKYPRKVSNLHMGFREDIDIQGIRNITFLYKLENGISSGSYGIECARLADIPEGLLETASKQAEYMQKTVQRRAQASSTRKVCKILRELLDNNGHVTRDQLEELHAIVQYLSALTIQ